MKARFATLFVILCLLLAGWRGTAQTLVWQETRSAAVTQALSQGKLILLLAGRHTCPNCNYMQNTACETLSPAIKPLIQERFVPWFCVIDDSTEWYTYSSGLGSFTLPLICCIDPRKPNQYLDRTTGVQALPTFYERLLVQGSLPATNILFKQYSIANGRVTLSVTNLAAGRTNYLERSLDLQSWTPVAQFTSRGTNWSEPLSAGWAKAFYRVSVKP